MGIKNLMKIIERFAPQAVSDKKITDYANKKLAIDANLMIYKSIFALRKNGYDLKNNGIVITHLHVMLSKIIGMLRYKITPIFVFDGESHSMKQATLKEREETKKKLSLKYYNATTESAKKKYYYLKSDVTYKEIDDCRQMIKFLGLPIIDAPEEADSQCAYLSRKNLVYGVVSDDMDMLLFGAKRLIKNFSVSETKKMQEIDLSKTLKYLDLSYDQLIELGILLGCDYCDKIMGVGMIGAYQKIRENNIDILIKKRVITNIDYLPIKNYFKNAKVNKHVVININAIDYDKFREFMTKFKFTKKYIDKQVNLLKQLA